MTTTPLLDQLLFAILPYVAMVLFFLGTVWRYRAHPFSYSSMSSQLLENKQHFWAVVPFHYGIIGVLAGHIIGCLIPSKILLWNSVPLRLYVLETTALVFGLLALIGFLGVVARRITDSKVKSVTTTIDWVVYALLLVSLGSGVYTAIFHRWGSSWFAAAMVPYVYSLIRLTPDINSLAALPWGVKIHVLNAWLLISFFPFSRLVHVLVAPNPYLWRKRQVVRWYRWRRPAADAR